MLNNQISEREIMTTATDNVIIILFDRENNIINELFPCFEG